MCIDLDKSQLSDAFGFVYGLSRQNQDLSLPVIGDIVRRLSLSMIPKKTPEIGRVDRIMMLGEVERLETFKTWPHQNYE